MNRTCLRTRGTGGVCGMGAYVDQVVWPGTLARGGCGLQLLRAHCCAALPAYATV